ncbi:MAG TPA: mechanosensitive ion channel family protein [Longimicrobiaceae bacterium]|nr:mechanosensitive ion channel family protein [Longimicrobiaceae bacterium]
MTVLDWTFYSNPLRAWAIAAVTAIVVFLLLRLALAFVLKQLRRLAGRTAVGLDDLMVHTLSGTRWWFLAVVAVMAGSLALELPPNVRTGLKNVSVLLTLVQLGIWGERAVSGQVRRYTERRLVEDPASVTSIRAIGFVLNVAVWAGLLLVALSTLGLEITPLLTGLGIGGIAVALAVQNILGDLFASLSIVLDKPFVIGDFIIVDDYMGTVESVGLKTTRVNSLSGEKIVFSNSDLLKSRIRNYRQMEERRIVFSFGIDFRTSRDDVARIPETVREIIQALPDTRFDRAHFKSFGASSLDFEVVYYVLKPDFNLYMDRQQAINLAMLDRFTERGIEFAFPTRTVFVQSTPDATAGAAS